MFIRSKHVNLFLEWKQREGKRRKRNKPLFLINRFSVALRLFCCKDVKMWREIKGAHKAQESVSLICFFFFQFCFFRVKELETDVENKDDKLSELQKR